MRYFVFVDTPYYPYVDDPIEADTLEDARAQITALLRPGDDTTVYLVPVAEVTSFRMEGPKPEPKGLLKLMQEQNRHTRAMLDAKQLHGGYSTFVEAGSL